MAIRAPFRLLLASLIGISTPIAIWPACAESQSPSSDFFEVSAPSPPSGDPVRPTQAVDTNKEEPSLQDDSWYGFLATSMPGRTHSRNLRVYSRRGCGS